MGATTSLMAAAKESSIFNTIFVAGIDVDIPYANQYTLDSAMAKAVAGNNKKLIQKITELKNYPIVDSKKFQKRAKILTNLGGIKTGSNYSKLLFSTVKNIFFSRFYGIGGLIKTMKGMELCQNALLSEFNEFNLFDKVKKISVPVYFIQGSLDGVAPIDKSRAYYEHLKADKKSFTVFENSAHMPQYEEYEKFSKLIRSILHN